MFVRKKLFNQFPANETICTRCLMRLSVSPFSTRQNLASPDRYTSYIPRRRTFRREYFSDNGILGVTALRIHKSMGKGMVVGTMPNASPCATEVLYPPSVPSTSALPEIQNYDSIPEPLPRKMRRRYNDTTDSEPQQIPLDASNRLSTLSTNLPPDSLRRLLTTCLALSKPRLSFLIILTTATAYTLYPIPAALLPAATTLPSLSALTLAYLTTGTGLCCASANTLNMLLEPAHDAKMSRTRNRPLVRGLISKRGALIFAAVTGALGTTGLYLGVNPTVAFLGALNIALYAGVYTPLKRISAVNTWVGALVGGIPPLMGWAAAAGQSAMGTGEWQELLLGQQNIGGWLLATLLFAWQFPHFNALSWPIRDEYKAAGYRMLAWTNPRRNGRVALRYSLLLFPICVGLTWAGVTDQAFVVTSSVVNVWMAREAWRFWRLEGHKGSARGLFWASIWQLPVVMVLAMAQKKGLWEGVWRGLMGEAEGDREREETLGVLGGENEGECEGHDGMGKRIGT